MGLARGEGMQVCQYLGMVSGKPPEWFHFKCGLFSSYNFTLP